MVWQRSLLAENHSHQMPISYEFQLFRLYIQLAICPFIIPTGQEISFQQSTLHINTESKLIRTKTQDTITYLIKQQLNPTSEFQTINPNSSKMWKAYLCPFFFKSLPNDMIYPEQLPYDIPSLRHRSLETELSESPLVGVGITAFCLSMIISSFMVVVFWRLKSERAKKLNRLSDIEKAEGDGDGGGRGV